jgi:hypothetical protein
MNNLRFTRTVDGEDDLECDSVLMNTLNVTGDSFLNNLYVSGITNIPGGVVSLTDINCNSIIVATTSSLNTLTVSGLSTLAGLLATSITASGVVAGASFSSSGNGGFATVSAGTVGASVLNGTTVNAGTVNATTVTASGVVSGASISTAGSGTFGTVSASSVTASGVVSGGSLSTAGTMTSASVSTGALGATSLTTSGAVTGSTAVFNGGVASTSFTSGTVVITGGLGVSGNIWIDNGSIAGGVNSSVGVGLLNSQFILANGLTNSTSPSTGALRVDSGGLGVGLDAYVGGHVTSANGDNATSSTTGAIIVPNGGIGCSRDIWGGSRVIANSTADGPASFDPYSLSTEGGCFVRGSLRILNGPFNAGNGLSYFASLTASDTTQSTSVVTGAAVIAGGVGIGKSLTVGDTVITPALVLNGINFGFDQGSWTPNYTTYKETSPGSQVWALSAWAGPVTIVKSNGYYTRVGRMVTISWDIEYIVDGLGNHFSGIGGETRFPAITNLPFQNNISAQQTSDATGSFPNGYVNATPTPGTYLMGEPYTAILKTAGNYQIQYPPFYPNIGTLAVGGSTIVFEANISYWAIAIPTWEGPGTLFNYNISQLITGYNLATSGSITYFT